MSYIYAENSTKGHALFPFDDQVQAPLFLSLELQYKQVAFDFCVWLYLIYFGKIF